VCEYCSLTLPEYLKNCIQSTHSSWMFSSCHKLIPWSTTSWHISVHVTLWELILMGIYEWTSNCTICQVFRTIKDSTMKTHCWTVHLTARVLNPDLKINDLSTALLATCFHTSFSYLAYSSTLETTCFSKTPVDFQWTTWCYIPNDRTLSTSVNCAMSSHHTGKFHSDCRQNIMYAVFIVLLHFLTSHVSIQNKQVWSKESLHVIQLVPFHSMKVLMWCDVLYERGKLFASELKNMFQNFLGAN
jgi:hypothetical protein